MIRYVLAIILVSNSFTLCSQGIGLKEIEGRVLDATTREPVAYANVYNKDLQKGTITNLEGFFRLPILETSDSVVVIFLGYTIQTIQLDDAKSSYTVLLKESQQLLREIVVRPKDDSYLYKLVTQCRNNPGDKGQSKAYYSLKTTADGQQVELVEGYYNASIAGYELTGLTLKAGRLAMQPFQDRLFASFESSRAITMMRWTQTASLFPVSPLDLSRQELKKRYELELDKKYLDEQRDSVYIITFAPTDTSGLYFSGSVWINTTKAYVVKIQLSSDHCARHPFKAIFPTDTISNVSFSITKTFVEQNGKIMFNHIDFIYGIDYSSRRAEEHERFYSVQTRAILYAYDFNHLFDIPSYVKGLMGYNDYRQINAMPYNDFFWTYHDEYGLSDDRQANDAFFADPASVTNQTLFSYTRYFKKGMFERPFIRWSEDRVILKAMAPDTTSGLTSVEPISPDSFHFEIKLLADINTYHDSTDILTAAILDPYKTYDYKEIDSRTQCFLNLYFDLCEIERRQLEAELEATGADHKAYVTLNEASQSRLAKISAQFFKETDRGLNQANMLKWNAYVKAQLEIDNVALFKLYSHQ